MDTIIAGIFLNERDSRQAAADLARGPVGTGATAHFYNSPLSHHVPATRDNQAAPGVESGASDGHAAAGAGAGVAPGAMAGLAAAPVVGPFGPAIGATLGAYVGSLVGALEGQSAQQDKEGAGPPPVRRGGPMLAVVVATPDQAEEATRLLDEAGAVQIERAIGHIIDGSWIDYDPDSVPYLILDRSPAAGAP